MLPPETNFVLSLANPPCANRSRRATLSHIAAAIGAVVFSSQLVLKAKAQASGTPTSSLTSLHQEMEFKIPPRRIYELLLDSKQFAACSGAPAEIDPKAGGAFSMFGGVIVGRTIELVPNRRVVQAWRPTHWPAGVYSLVKFELKANAAVTNVVLDHTGFPQGDSDSLSEGWKSHYWEPMKKYFA